MKRSTLTRLLSLAAVSLAAALPQGSHAQDATNAISSGGGFFGDWMARASRIQSEQPHWLTPLTTVTPRLEQEFRYDQSFERKDDGSELTSYGYGKGLELIPCQNVEVILGVPAWQGWNNSKVDGFNDETFLLKYRLLSANEENGDYIVTAFLGLSVPTGSKFNQPNDDAGNNPPDHFVVTPTIASGKGWGPFDIQNTIGIGLPDDGSAHIGPGMPLAINTAFQYKVLDVLCPELDVNYTYFANGRHEGLNEVFLTPSLLMGRFKIHDRLGVTLGLGYQVAVTDKPLYNHNFILSARIPF